MKKIKSFISLLLAFTMLMSIAPISFAEDVASINIETTSSYYNISNSMSFYASIPVGSSAIRVYADNTLVDAAIDELADNRCKITIPANSFTKYPYAQIKIEADYADGTKTAERAIRTYLSLSTEHNNRVDMSQWTEAMGDNLVKSDGVPDGQTLSYNKLITNICNKVGIFDKNIQFATLVRKTGLGGKASDDVSLAIAGPRAEGVTSQPYVAIYPGVSAYTPEIIDMQFKLYFLNEENFTLRLTGYADIDTTQSVGELPLTPGVWNDVSLQINFDENKLVYQIDNGSSIKSGSDDLTITGIRYMRFWMQPAVSESAEESFIAIDDIKVDYHDTTAKRFKLISPSNGDIFSGEFNADVNVIDAKKLYLYVDGERVSEKEGITGNQSYSFTINSSDIGYGDKEIKVISVYEDGTLDSGNAVVSIKEGVVSDFNNMPDWTEHKVSSSEMTGTMKSGLKWYANSAKNTTEVVSRVAGRSGKDGDYALDFSITASEAQSSNAHRLYFADTGKEVLGTYNIEFDMKINTSTDAVRLYGPNLWEKYKYNTTTFKDLFIFDGKIVGTNYEVTPGKWIHYNLRFVDSKWYVTVHEYDTNGLPVNKQIVVNGKAQSEENTAKEISLALWQIGDRTEATRAGITIDNARVWFEDCSGGIEIESLAYDTDKAVSNNAIPCTAKKLVVNLNKAATADDVNTELYVNNKKVDADVTIDSAALTVSLPELNANSKIKLVLKDPTETWTDVESFVYVSDENALYTACLEYFADKSQFIAHTVSAKSLKLNAYVATYSNNEMTGLSVSDVIARSGDNCTLISAGNNEKAKIMIWDSNAKPVMKAYTPGE